VTGPRDRSTPVATGAGRAPRDWPAGSTTVVGTIGHPVRHSLSPRLHQAAFAALGLDWVSVAFDVDAGGAGAALAGMRILGLAGLSVTMPHKQDAARVVDDLSDTARRLDAVNCIVPRGGRLRGESTDGAGFLAALGRSTGFDPAGRRCMVVGAGGAARAVVLALAEAGAADVVVVNRTASTGAAAAALAGAAGRLGSTDDVDAMDLVVQATPVGMVGVHPGEVAFDPGLLHEGQVVADLIYHPSPTPLVMAARRQGARAVNGLGMLVHQAALAVELWTGAAVPVEAMWAAVADQGG
jgi:shikimate dehydrogenase